MLNKKILLRFSLAMLAMILTSGLPTLSRAATDSAKSTATQKESNVVKGKILGVSKKAKTITVKGSKGPIMVKFDDSTKGMEFAKKGEAAIIKFSEKDGSKVATVIKQKLAKLPKGVTEIQPEQLAELVNLGPEKGNFMLIDARPSGPYNKGHIQYAHSIPVKKMKERLITNNRDDLQMNPA